MTVGRFLVLLSGSALGMMPGPSLANRFALAPMSAIGNDLRLRCQEVPGSAPIEAHSCGKQAFILCTPSHTEQADREKLQYALAVNPRHRLFKHRGTVPGNSQPTQSSRDQQRNVTASRHTLLHRLSTDIPPSL